MAFRGEKPYTFQKTKDQRVRIQFRGKTIMTLVGYDAAEFMEEASSASIEELQFLMAAVTGQFKHGNERVAKNHPRNRS